MLISIYCILTFYFLNLYKEITRFSGLNVLLSFFRAVLIYGFLFALLIFIFRIEGVPLYDWIYSACTITFFCWLSEDIRVPSASGKLSGPESFMQEGANLWGR